MQAPVVVVVTSALRTCAERLGSRPPCGGDYHINKWSFSSTYLYGGSRGARTPDLLGVNEAL